jgi:predicted DCC family thiol-disulfide oxidoreductase YuxK
VNEEHDYVFYDGACGLCHRSVRIAALGDKDGTRFRFAPLGGRAFSGTVRESQRARVPDSIVVWTVDGRLLVLSDAVLHMMHRLGGWMRVAATIGFLAPRAWRDAVYRFVARHRQRWFRRPEGVCPILPPEIRTRFLD